MKELRVNLGERSYDIRIGTGVLPLTKPVRPGVGCLIVTDSNVGSVYLPKFAERMGANGFEVHSIAVPAGEASKSLAVVEEVWEKAATLRLDRDALIVALGGGVVGDLAGFVAATYLRGVRLLQVPTTLLAMVDSSVGGKTGVNLPQGKNLVGSFHQPVEVVADLATLSSLPAREYTSGLAEVVKYGVIWNADLFRELESHADALGQRDGACLESVIGRCCEIKAEVVAVDEKESGLRAILNYGHTLGHAIENVAGYGKLLHGEAVAIGMVFAARVSVEVRSFAVADARRIEVLLHKLGLPCRLADRGITAGWDSVREAMVSDKKTRGRVPRFVLSQRMGSVIVGCEVPEEILKRVLGSL